MGKIWTDEEDQYLIKNCRSVKDIPKATEKLGRTANSIRGHVDYISEKQGLNFFEIGKARWDVAEEKKLEKMYNEGLTAKEIAKVLGRTKSAINNHTNLLGLKRERKRRSDADLPAPVKRKDIELRLKQRECEHINRQKAIKEAIPIGSTFITYTSDSGKPKRIEDNKTEYIVLKKYPNFVQCKKKTKNGAVIKKGFPYLEVYKRLNEKEA